MHTHRVSRTTVFAGFLGLFGLLSLTGAGPTSLPAQEMDARPVNPGRTTESPYTVNLDVTFGVTSFLSEDTGTDTYQFVALRPGLSVGDFAIGLDLPLNYRFTGENGTKSEIREEDWVPDSDHSFLDVYLPKLRYLRYGTRGDLFHLRLGKLSGTTLGNGFVLNNYSNQLFLPDQQIVGGLVDVDGAGVGFPYLGLQTVVADAASWNLTGGRLFVRPFSRTGISVLSARQLGVTYVMDRDPSDIATDHVVVWGVDLRQPVLDSDRLALTFLGDVAVQKSRQGVMAGFTGRAAGILLFGGQLRIMDANFIPEYFDYSYDLRREQRYAVYNGDFTIPGRAGWLGRLGFTLLEDTFIFDTVVRGSFTPEPGSYPELHSVLTLEEGLIPGFSAFSAQGSYTKFDIRRWNDFTDAENAIIGVRFNIRSGQVVVSLRYDLTYDPYTAGDPTASGEPWVVTSGLESTISF